MAGPVNLAGDLRAAARCSHGTRPAALPGSGGSRGLVLYQYLPGLPRQEHVPSPRFTGDAGQLGGTGRTRGRNPQMQAIGTWVEGGGLIGLGQLAEGAALMAAALPADPAVAGRRDLDSAALLSAAYLAMGAVDRYAVLSEPMLAAAGRPAIRSPPQCSPGPAMCAATGTASATWLARPGCGSPPTAAPLSVSAAAPGSAR